MSYLLIENHIYPPNKRNEFHYKTTTTTTTTAGHQNYLSLLSKQIHTDKHI